MKAAGKEMLKVNHPSGKILKKGQWAVLLGDTKLRSLASIVSPYFPFDADVVSEKLAISKARKAAKDESLPPAKNATEIKLEWKQYGFLTNATADLVKAVFVRAKNAEGRVGDKQLSRKDFLEIVVEPSMQKVLESAKAPPILMNAYFNELSTTLADFYECYDAVEQGAMVADLDTMVFGAIPLVAQHRTTGRTLLCEWKCTSQAPSAMKFGKYDDPCGPAYTVVEKPVAATSGEGGVEGSGGAHLALMNEQALKDRRLAHLFNGKAQSAGLKMALLGHIALRNEYSFGTKAAKAISTAGFGRKDLDQTILDKFDLGVITIGRDPEAAVVAEKVPVILERDLVADRNAMKQLQVIDQGTHEGKAMLSLERPGLTISQLRLVDPSWFLPPGNDLGVDSHAGQSTAINGSSALGERLFFDSVLMA